MEIGVRETRREAAQSERHLIPDESSMARDSRVAGCWIVARREDAIVQPVQSSRWIKVRSVEIGAAKYSQAGTADAFCRAVGKPGESGVVRPFAPNVAARRLTLVEDGATAAEERGHGRERPDTDEVEEDRGQHV